MPKARGLTPKQVAFVAEYLVDLNATQAAIRAGYSAKTSEWQGPQLLGKPHVAAAIAKGKAERQERTGITADLVLQRLLDIATVDVNELVEYRLESCPDCWPREVDEARIVEPNAECPRCLGDGMGRPFFKDTRKLSPAARALYAGVKVTKDGIEVKMQSRDKALELLGDHLGLFVKRHELSGKGGAPLQPAPTLSVTPEQLRDAVAAALQKV